MGDGHLKFELQTSDWALSEMVQYFRDRAILKQFIFDGHVISSFNRYKHWYKIGTNEIGSIHDALADFESYLCSLEIEIVEARIDRLKIHDYCLRYSLETPDALQVLAAKNSRYLVTTDTKLKNSGIANIIDPSTLITVSKSMT